MVSIILPDGSKKQFDFKPTALDVAKSIGSRLAQESVGVRIQSRVQSCLQEQSQEQSQDCSQSDEGPHPRHSANPGNPGNPAHSDSSHREIQDIRTFLNDGDSIELITLKNQDANEVIRHTAAHVMAEAVQSLWPEIKVTIGPVIDTGFYYDFASPFAFTQDHFPSIEGKMEEIIERNEPLVQKKYSISEAIKIFSEKEEKYKVEIIEDLVSQGQTEVTIYEQGSWFDLCKGPHLQRTGAIKAFKILSVAGAYWRGDETKPMLQRLYATAFRDKKELEEYLFQVEEAKKRDHRKLGKELGLFHFHPWAPGSPFFTGKGSAIYTELQVYLRELYLKYGYQEVITPQLFDVELFKTSGHYEHYQDNMYFLKMDDRDFSAKPMNCPCHCLLYKTEKYSYRDLPLRIADFGRLHRFEKTGAMHGLTRVRTFCQDDAHIFCTLEQMQEEIKSFMSLLKEVYFTLGMMDFKIYLSTRPVKRMGSDTLWDQAEQALREALLELGLPFEINPGDGAFYGPKLDIMFVDAIKRPWQLGTLQVDFNLPQTFALSYTGEDNQEHHPVMLHRAILGSLERFIGVYLEHTGGHLPPWLAPTQVSILNVTDRVTDFCEVLYSRFQELQIRCEFDKRNEKLNFKIRQAQMHKVPYMVIIGDREALQGQVTIRLRSGENKGPFSVEEALHFIERDIKLRRLQAQLKEVGY
jgi:threonyl-tRNA synthetase